MSQGVYFGKYRLLEKIGQGGMAEIYKAQIKGIDGFEKILVLKKVLPAFSKNENFIKMLIEEAKLTSSLQHPNIVPIYELGEIDGIYFMAMEHVHGKDLLKLLSTCAKNKRRIPPEIVLYIVSEVCQGLFYAHTATDLRGNPLNIVHRDISPSNIIVSYSGDVKVTDFGVAKVATEKPETNTRSGVLKGKVGYMSPEQVSGEDIDSRSDIFSLGIIMYECLTLKRLFLGKSELRTLENIRDARIDHKLAKHQYIPEEVQGMLREALTKNPDMRYQTADELRDSIQDYFFAHRIKVNRNDLVAFFKEVFPVEEPIIPDLPLEEPTPLPVAAEPKPRRETRSTQRIMDMLKSKLPRHTDKLEDAQFKLKNADGKEFGPISFRNLINMFKSGAVSEDELISIDQSSWQHGRDVTMIRRLQEVIVPQEDADPIYSDSIDKLKLPEHFFSLWMRRFTGKVKLQYASNQKEIFLKQGYITHISSTRKSELLGRFLIARGLLTEQQLKEAMDLTAREGRRIGDSLIALKFVLPHELSMYLETLMQEKMYEGLAWNKGNISFYDNVDLPQQSIPIHLALPSLITEAVRRFYDEHEVVQYFKMRLHMVAEESRTAAIKIEELKLNFKEIKAVAQLDKVRSVKDIIEFCQRAGSNGFALLRVFFLLHQARILILHGT